MKAKLRTLAGAMGLFLMLSTVPAEAATVEHVVDVPTPNISASCADDGTYAVYYFTTGPEAYWSVTQAGDVLTYGETDNAPTDRYLQVLEIEPGVPFTVYANGAEATFTCPSAVLNEWPAETFEDAGVDVAPRSFGFMRIYAV